MLTELNNGDWRVVFGEDPDVMTSPGVVAVGGVSNEPAPRLDVGEILVTDYRNLGTKNLVDILGVFRLADGRFLAATGYSCLDGWSCHASNWLTAGPSVISVLLAGLSCSQRRRIPQFVLAAILPPEMAEMGLSEETLNVGQDYLYERGNDQAAAALEELRSLAESRTRSMARLFKAELERSLTYQRKEPSDAVV